MATVLSSVAETAGGMAAPVDAAGGGGVVVSIQCSLSQLRFDRTNAGGLEGCSVPVPESVRPSAAGSSSISAETLTAKSRGPRSRAPRIIKKVQNGYPRVQCYGEVNTRFV